MQAESLEKLSFNRTTVECKLYQSGTAVLP